LIRKLLSALYTEAVFPGIIGAALTAIHGIASIEPED
jgi:hypothetical protein